MAQPAPAATPRREAVDEAAGWVVPAYLALVWTLIPASAFGGLPSPVEAGGIVLLGLALWRAPSRPELARTVLLATALLVLPLATGWSGSRLDLGLPTDQLRDVAFIAIAALGLASAREVDRTLCALSIAGLLLGLGALYSIHVAPTTLFPLEIDEFGVEAPRAAGPFGESNFFALSLAALVPIQYFVTARGGGWRLVGVAGLIAVLGGIVATGSRGGLAAATAGLLLSVAFSGTLGASGRRLRVVALAAVAGAALLLPSLSGQVENSAARTVSGRATENRIALAMFADRPLLGTGPGGYPALYRDYARRIGNDPRAAREPHNLYLQILAEQGIAGALGWLGAAIVVGAAIVRRRLWSSPAGLAIVFSIVTFLLGSLFLHGSVLRLLFVMVGMALALAYGPAREPEARA